MIHIALVPRGISVPEKLRKRVAGAIQAQLCRDLLPAWRGYGAIEATIDSYSDESLVPDGAVCVYLVADAKGNAGYHVEPVKNPAGPEQIQTACAFVQYRADDMHWSISASHEVCELVVDINGNAIAKGLDPTDQQSAANILIEVCDPCQDASFSYSISTFPEILLSNFCLPAYYGLGDGDLTIKDINDISNPFEIAYNGYLRYQQEDGTWMQYEKPAGYGQVVPIKNDAVLAALDIGGKTNWRGILDRSEHGYAGPHIDRDAARKVTKTLQNLIKMERAMARARHRVAKKYLSKISS